MEEKIRWTPDGEPRRIIYTEGWVCKGITYFKRMYIHAIEKKWGIDLSSISNQGKAEKRFDLS